MQSGFSIGGYWRFLKVLKRLKPDILNFHLGPYVLRYVAFLRGYEYIVFTEHDSLLRPPKRSEIKGLAWLNRAAERCTSRFVTLTQTARNHYIEKKNIPAEKVITIPLGIELTSKQYDLSAIKETYGLSSQIPVLCFVGRLTPEKRPLTFIDIIEAINKCRPCYGLVAGDGPLKEELVRVITDRQLTDRIKVLGYLDDPGEVYAVADVLVSCSEYESFSLVSLEAMRQGLPVIAANSGEIADIVIDGKTGYLVPGHAFDSFDKAILAVLNDGKRYQQLSRNAKAYIRDYYDIQHIAEQYSRLFSDIS